MPKIVAWTVLHYGREYLGYAAHSVLDYVDEWHVAYTPVGSHGHHTGVPCPETRDELYAIASEAGGAKLHWHEGEWPYEGAHREMIHTYAPDADVILVLDSDEIWPKKLFNRLIWQLENSFPQYKHYRVPMIHFWRSFHRAVLHDPAYPTRIIVPSGRTETTLSALDYGYIAHMGYAQSSEIVRYKWQVHGHKNEMRQGIDWFRDRWDSNAQFDCHPVGSEYWNPEDVDPLAYMPLWMAQHPYYRMELIP